MYVKSFTATADSLLLCILKDNPYCRQTRWIETPNNSHRLDAYFCGVTGVSLKGNTYWFAEEAYSETPSQGDHIGFLLCFDFTRETFGPRLPLPVEWYLEDTLLLSNVRDEQLAVLFQRKDTLQMEIWVTTKIEPNTVSWSSKFFLSVDMRELTGSYSMFLFMAASFFIDEEKKVAVVFDKGKKRKMMRNAAYIVGEDGSLKEVDLGESPNKKSQTTCVLLCSKFSAT
ncbi:unnamed protein product [Arabidopsis halleri]